MPKCTRCNVEITHVPGTLVGSRTLCYPHYQQKQTEDRESLMQRLSRNPIASALMPEFSHASKPESTPTPSESNDLPGLELLSRSLGRLIDEVMGMR